MEKSDMRRTRLNFGKLDWTNLLEMAAVGILLAGGFPARSVGQQQGQKTFSSPENAINALVVAAQNNDEEGMLDILGPDGRQIVSSGDETEDAQNRSNFVQRFQEMHRLVKEPDGTIVLYIGAKNWPTPIPLANKGNSWYFDTDAGKKEILFRRIGRNEISTIRVCQELVAAEKDYHSAEHAEYAQKIFSDEGQHNGLCWKVSDGEPQSPIGPLVASAVAEGYVKGKDAPSTPYRGYFFHSLGRQGKDAPGGAKNYIVNGKMTEGFAFVAYPAEYRSSGVMTFIVNQDGVVYQKDLGKKTEALGKSMHEYNPDSSWSKAEEEPTQTASGQKRSNSR
jgi:glycosidase